jgi:hypothetical protein
MGDDTRMLRLIYMELYMDYCLRCVEMIQGKLDQSKGLLEVDNSIGRDIRMTEIPTIIDTLESWSEACEDVLGTLQTQMDRANAERTNKIQRKDQLEVEVMIII